jgi:type II secretory pathway pseudopilin PulG
MGQYLQDREYTEHSTLLRIICYRDRFSLVEILIVAAIIGIIAALIMPTLQQQSTKAKESAAKDTLRVLRNAIELYAAQHNDVAPGYPNNNPSANPTFTEFSSQMVGKGKHLSGLPENPFSGKTDIRIIQNGEEFPTEPADTDGWIYKPLTKEIRLDSTGADSAGFAY